MDLSKLSRGQLIAGVGGVLLVLSLFLGWVSVFGGTQTAFDAFSGMDIIMLVIGAAAVAFAAVTASEASIDLPGNAAVILAVLAVLVVGWALGWVLEEPSAGFGAWLGLIGAGAIAYGSWEAHRSPVPMAATRPAQSDAPKGAESPAPPAGATSSPPARAKPSAPPGAKSSGAESSASPAQATASAAEATAAAAQERPSAADEETRRHDQTTVEQSAARPRPDVAPGGEADTIAPRPPAEQPEPRDAGSSRPDGG